MHPAADPGGAVAPDDGVHEFSTRALGSAIRLHVRSAAPGGVLDAAAAWDEVRDELAAVDAALSRFRDDSEVTRLNRRAGSGGTAPVSRRLRIALATSRRAKAMTGGRFDAGLADVLDGIGEHGASLDPAAEPSPQPSPDPWPQARRPPCVPPVPADLGGVGKGLAIRWAAARAIGRLPVGSGLLLDAGGDLVASGVAPGGGWLVGVEDPLAAGPATAEPLAVIAVERGAVATSSVRIRHWTTGDGTPVHHLLDPRTRAPARTGLIAVTVAAPDPAWAEVWTKALFLAGREAIGREARSRGLAAWWVDAHGRLGMTPDARVRSVWVDDARMG